MPPLALIVLAGAALLAVTLVLCFRLMVRAISRAIEQRHRALEHILETKEPPEHWPASRRLKKLDKLISYAKNSPFLADEATRLAVALEAYRTAA